MIQVDKNKWEIYDPDNVLKHELEGFDTRTLKFLGDIHPREDLMSFTHKESNYIVDFGYYGCEVDLDGYWAVHVINGNIEQAWSNLVERHDSKDFLAGINNVQNMLTKYT